MIIVTCYCDVCGKQVETQSHLNVATVTLRYNGCDYVRHGIGDEICLECIKKISDHLLDTLTMKTLREWTSDVPDVPEV